MMLASMLEELMQDQDFLEFIAGEVEGEEDGRRQMEEDMTKTRARWSSPPSPS
jgi:hypothetical protein